MAGSALALFSWGPHAQFELTGFGRARSLQVWSRAKFQSIVSNATSYSWGELEHAQKKGRVPAPLQLMDPLKAADDALAAELSRSARGSAFLAAVSVNHPCIVLPSYGIVIVASSPPIILDIAGGCCRPSAPIQSDQLVRVYKAMLGKAWWQSLWVRTGSLLGLAHEVTDRTVVHRWLLPVIHAHSSSFFHAVAECGYKLMWSLRLLRNHPEIRVMHGSKFVGELLGILGLPDRGFQASRLNPAFAGRLSMPPSLTADYSLYAGPTMRSLAGAIRAPPGLRSATKPSPVTSAPAVLIVRRGAGARHGGRAMLNHDELVVGLRQLLPPTVTLKEFPPEGMPIVTAASVWSQAHVAICPHGAGCTNMVFMPPNSTIFEIIADGQTGRVYQGLAVSLGHRYVECLYNRTVARAHSQLGFARNSPYTSFVLDVPWLLERIRKSGTLKTLRRSTHYRTVASPASSSSSRPRKASPTRGLLEEGQQAVSWYDYLWYHVFI